MASGKSLELAEIPKRRGKALCICGAIFEDHLTKDGKKKLAKYDNPQHVPAGLSGFNRRSRRKLGY